MRKAHGTAGNLLPGSGIETATGEVVPDNAATRRQVAESGAGTAFPTRDATQSTRTTQHRPAVFRTRRAHCAFAQRAARAVQRAKRMRERRPSYPVRLRDASAAVTS